MSLVTRKPVFGVCDQVRHKLACTAKDTRQRLEISNIETRGIILSRQRPTKALIRLRGKNRFSHDVAHILNGWLNVFLFYATATISELPHDKTNKMTCAPSEDLDQPGNPPSLIRVLLSA